MFFRHHKTILAAWVQTYGLQKRSALQMCKQLRIAPFCPAETVPLLDQRKAFAWIQKRTRIDFELKNREVQAFVHLYGIRHLKSLKHRFFLPINGQRNCTNGRTARREAPRLRARIYKHLKEIAKRKKKLQTASTR